MKPKFNDAFWRWFGDSVVCNEDGSPKVVYHGTQTKEIREFRMDKKLSDYGDTDLGFFFSGAKQCADEFGTMSVAAYLSMKNPVHIDALEFFNIINDHPAWYARDFRRLRRQYIKAGHDGIIVSANVNINRLSGPGWGQFDCETYIVFRPEQIKSVYNDGTWDADDPRVGSNPFSVPSRNPPKIDGVEYGYAGIREGFKITGPYGETAIGYAYSADFPNDIGSPSRGELFLVNVPEEARGRGAGKAISIEALKLMTSHGAETVVMHATSVGGQRIIDSLIMDGYISEPIRASSTGKKEYRIHNDGVWDADEHGLHTGARP